MRPRSWKKLQRMKFQRFVIPASMHSDCPGHRTATPPTPRTNRRPRPTSARSNSAGSGRPRPSRPTPPGPSHRQPRSGQCRLFPNHNRSAAGRRPADPRPSALGGCGCGCGCDENGDGRTGTRRTPEWPSGWFGSAGPAGRPTAHDRPSRSRTSAHRWRTHRWQVFGLPGSSGGPRSAGHLLATASQAWRPSAQLMAVVPGHRCGAVPDSHRIPCCPVFPGNRSHGPSARSRLPGEDSGSCHPDQASAPSDSAAVPSPSDSAWAFSSSR